MRTVSEYISLLRNRVQRELKTKQKYYAEYFAENVNNIKKCGKA